jgi:hypothetical protein
VKEIEVNFCTGDDVYSLKTIAVPRQGEVVQISGLDFIVTRVFWTLDYARVPHIDTSLRATVECRLLRSDTVGGE